MIEFKLAPKSDFVSSVINGRLVIKVFIPESVHKFTVLDMYKPIKFLVSRYNEAITDTIYGEVIELRIENSKQYVIAREIPKNSLQQFEDCCV